jgi:hypothetical protein
MRLFTIVCFAFCVLAFSGCGRAQAVRVLSAEQFDGLVGRRVELVGVVTTNSTPQILGVDLWGLEKFAGQRLRVSGILQRTVITRTGGDTSKAVDSAPDAPMPLVFRGPGTYYRLQDLSYVADM